jgi:hypothetical protein
MVRSRERRAQNSISFGRAPKPARHSRRSACARDHPRERREEAGIDRFPGEAGVSGGAGRAGWHRTPAIRKAVSSLHGFRPRRGYVAPRWVLKALSMDAELGISKWAIAALVAAMIVVGAMGLVLSASAGQGSTADRAPSANAPAQSH